MFAAELTTAYVVETSRCTFLDLAPVRYVTTEQLFWQNEIFCKNCLIRLTFVALNRYSAFVADYCYDGDDGGSCAILDAGSIGIYMVNDDW